MPKSIIEQLQEINKYFPNPEPVPPTAFALGVAEQLRDMAAQIETSDLRITHFTLTTRDDSKQRLEIEVE